MLRIEKNIKELLPDLDARKRANIKSHLIKQIKNNNESDSQLILFNLLIDEHEKNKKLEEQGATSMSSNILEELKTAMEKRDTSKIPHFDSYIEIQHKRIEQEEEDLNEIEEKIGEYHQVIGERVLDWSNVRYDTTQYTTIYSKQSYLEFMEMGEKQINKAVGVTQMRLKQQKQEILRDKSLNKFR